MRRRRMIGDSGRRRQTETEKGEGRTVIKNGEGEVGSNHGCLKLILFIDCSRMENVDLRSSRSQVKIMGTLLSILGAMIVTLYKGLPIGPHRLQSDALSFRHSILSLDHSFSISTTANNWVIGGVFLATATLCLSIWNIFQAAILKGYPSETTIVAFYCLFGTIQSAAVSLIAESDHPNAWKLRPDIELISIVYSAVFGGAITCCVETWCIHKKGPVFVAMFKPIGIAIAAFMSVIFLGDTLHVGSVIGAIVIVLGFYGVIWSQSKEEKDDVCRADNLPSSSSHNTPLLQDHGNA